MLYRIGPLPLCLSASARTWQQPTTVSFWNSAILSGKNKKNNSSDTQCFVQRKWFLLFLPRMMFSVAKQRVMMAGYVPVSLLTGTKPWQQHESSKSGNISRGVLKVIVNIRNLNNYIIRISLSLIPILTKSRFCFYHINFRRLSLLSLISLVFFSPSGLSVVWV